MRVAGLPFLSKHEKPRSTRKSTDSCDSERASRRPGTCRHRRTRHPVNIGSSCRTPKATSFASSERVAIAGGRERNQTNQGPRRSRSVARVIFHVDMDAFYVSVERREKPELVGQPVNVRAEPKKGPGSGVGMAASIEA